MLRISFWKIFNMNLQRTKGKTRLKICIFNKTNHIIPYPETEGMGAS